MYVAERVRGGLVGLLVGDALGVPYEFHPAEALPPLEQLEMEPPPGFARAHAGVPPGTWSDDGAQALALLASLLAQGRLDLADFAQRLLAWRMRGYMAVDSRVFDVGVQTHRALEALARGVPPAEAGPAEERANGNGSLMRVLPLALWHRGSDEALVQDAMLQSNPTHRHPRARVCCALYCLWARYELLGLAQAWEKAVSTLEALLPEASAERSELDRHVRPRDNPPVQGSGYVVDSLHSARWALEQGSGFEQVVRLAISLGNDTDTTACVAGGIAGIRYGYGAIPARWREGLRGQALYQGLLEQLLQAAT
ncbi:MAG: ADP-ribosylglycohydrolase family protein [Meiothermus sp.]|nr:ADP-ribosylglycohydrolase family protein [Meiothermus sp.]